MHICSAVLQLKRQERRTRGYGTTKGYIFATSFFNVRELEQLAKCLHCYDKPITADKLWSLNSVIGTVNTLRVGMS